MITISTKPEDRYLEDMEDLRKTRVAISLLDNPLIKEKSKKKRGSVYKIKPGQLSGVNIDDMRKGEGLTSLAQQHEKRKHIQKV